MPGATEAPARRDFPADFAFFELKTQVDRAQAVLARLPDGDPAAPAAGEVVWYMEAALAGAPARTPAAIAVKLRALLRMIPEIENEDHLDLRYARGALADLEALS